MKNKFIWLVLSFLLVAAMLLASCATSITTSTPTPSTTSVPTSTTTSSQTETSTTSTPPTTTATTTAATGNWWDNNPQPQYGGSITVRIPNDPVVFDPIVGETLPSIESGWLERLTTDNWTEDPSVYSFQTGWVPTDYQQGLLAESWEFPESNTYVVHLRQNVYWQNIPPVNGRQLVASDVVWAYDRLLGLGDGFTQPAPYYTTVNVWKNLVSITALDNYTVAFTWKINNPEAILETMQAQVGASGDIVPPEAVQQWGDVRDWHHAIGTGPFILQDFVDSSTATLVKNTNYWGTDERYPQNKLPYVDKVNILIMPDAATALAALRTGKIDVMDQLSLQQAQNINKTSPQILQKTVPATQATTVDPRNDVKPFSDIKVREALQMSIDLQSIAKDYYGGFTSPDPSTLTSNYLAGWGFAYNLWPQDLKDQYAYNPTQAKALLAAAGYPKGFDTDIVVDQAADLNLLQVVKSYFAAVGVNMDIRPLPTTSWTAFVQTGHKQDALAERGSSSLGETYEPTMQFAKYYSGYSGDWMMVNDPVIDAAYTNGLGATSLADFKKALTDANMEVAEQHFAISLLQPMTFALYQPWLHGYAAQANAVSGGSSPRILGFYCARFWIDQSLKKNTPE